MRVSISTAMSSIMHAEYCFVPCELIREPCGIVHVCTRATSIISSVATIDTLEDGTISPCRLKFTTYANAPSGVICIVAGKSPSITRPASESLDSGVLPQEAVRLAVRCRHEVELPIR